MYKIAILTGIGVGFSTMFGGLVSFFFKEISHKANDGILGFASGIMLAATIFSLIIPSMEGGGGNVYVTCAGIVCGALLISFLEGAVPHLHSFIGISEENRGINKVLLFVLAIAIHNFPEGLAVGVSFSEENAGNAFAIAAGISLQNIPEGIITVLPLLEVGVKRTKAFAITLFTGLVEVIGVLCGLLAVSVSEKLLPFILSFAGGTMLYVISHEMIPDTHSHGYEKTATFSLLFGFVTMLLIHQCF